MTNIQTDTWIKYTYWMIIGLLIYFCYGIWNSTERNSDKLIANDNLNGSPSLRSSIKESLGRRKSISSLERSNSVEIIEEVPHNKSQPASLEVEE